jgi:hypothetical protein
LTKSFSVTNLGAAADTFNLTVEPTVAGFAPQISPATLQLNPGASGTVQVTIPGGVLTPGEYEGAIHVQGNNTATDTHAMYWFGVPSGVPYLMNDLFSDTSDTAGQTIKAAIVFRVTDQSGIYISNLATLQPQVTYLGIDRGQGNPSGGKGAVLNVYNLDSYLPGTIAVDIKMDPHVGYYNYFQVSVGPNLTMYFYIQGQ